jgi:hypothetical protein
MAERLKKGNVWMVCVGCGYRAQYEETEVYGTAEAITCPQCNQQVLNVETKATKDWAN